MLKITSVEDLKKYLETRREMVNRQGDYSASSVNWKTGARHAFDEAIKAVEALLTHEHEEER